MGLLTFIQIPCHHVLANEIALNLKYRICNIPILTPLTLKIHDTYIVNNLGRELKAKAPPSIWLCCVSILGMVTDGYLDIWHIFNYGIM